MKTKLTLLTLLILIISCTEKVEPPEVLYKSGVKEVYKGNYNTAQKKFEKIDEEYPYSEEAKNATILLAYVNYRNKEYSNLIPIIDIYIKTNPRDSAVPYLFYLKAMSYYTQINSFKRDKEVLFEFKAITDLMIRNFPNSEYTLDLKLKYSYIVNTIALGELYVATQYQKSGNCSAATPRYISLLNWNEDSYYSKMIRLNLASCFDSLGMQEKATLFRNLANNIPE